MYQIFYHAPTPFIATWKPGYAGPIYLTPQYYNFCPDPFYPNKKTCIWVEETIVFTQDIQKLDKERGDLLRQLQALQIEATHLRKLAESGKEQKESDGTLKKLKAMKSDPVTSRQLRHQPDSEDAEQQIFELTEKVRLSKRQLGLIVRFHFISMLLCR